MRNVRFIRLDVYAETIAVGVAEPDADVRSLGSFPSRPKSIRKLIRKLVLPERVPRQYVSARVAG